MPDGIGGHIHPTWLEEATRNKIVDRSSLDAVRNLVEVVRSYQDELEHWLTGAEATSNHPTRAYLALTALQMAADQGAMRLK